MKYCEFCGAALADGSSFCTNCGNSVTKRFLHCTYCGADLEEGSQFCTVCGNAVVPSRQEDSNFSMNSGVNLQSPNVIEESGNTRVVLDEENNNLNQASLNKQDTVQCVNPKSSKHLIIGLSLFAVLAVGTMTWLVLNRQENSNSDYSVEEQIEGGTEDNIETEDIVNEMTAEELNSELSNGNTADLKMFQLKGPVKQVCWDDSYFQLDHRSSGFFTPRLLAYRKNGEISAIYYESYSYDFERNSNRVVYSYARGGDDYSIDRDTQGRIINIIDYDGNSNLLMWNENGLLAKDSYDYHAEYDDNDQIIMLWSDNDVYRFEYTKFDDHGNWTERVSNLGEVETRSISYYGEQDNPSSLKVVVDAGNLLLYLGPDTTYKRLQDKNQKDIHLQSGEKYTYLGELDGFYLIDYNGHEVYVDGKYAHTDR